LINELHARYLAERGITSKHITERRGYASSEQGLMIPWFSLPDGLPRGYEVRLDVITDGKKFARPKGQPTTLNIHPDMLDQVRDTSKTLFIVEGTTRCDALAERNVPSVSIPGCYNFMSEKAQLPDWDSLPMAGRQIIIGLDGDVISNANVNGAMYRLAELCLRKGAKRVLVLTLPASQGLDDWLGNGGDIFDVMQYAHPHDEIKALKPTRQLPETRARKAVGDINDVVLAQDFVSSAYNAARFDPTQAKWVVFDATRWVVTKSDAIVRGQVTDLMMDKARAITDDPEARDLLLSSAKISSVTLAVKSNPLIAARLDDFDTNGWLLNVSNGTLDLKTNELYPHDASLLVTQQAECAYDPNAKAPQFEAFIKWALPNEGVRTFVQKLLGQSLVGEVHDHVLPIFTGTGGNGKGTLLGAIRDILGDYAFEAKDDLLIDVKNPSHDEKDALLNKKRFVTCEEPQKGRLHMERVKKLSGGNQITASFKGETARTFAPSHTLCVATNTLPDFDGEDSPAVRRRLRIVEFTQTATEVDVHLSEKLRSEADGILLWLLEGLRLWRLEGLGEPAEVTAASVAALVDSDTLTQFLSDAVIVTGNVEDEVISQDLYKGYTEWMNRENFGKGVIVQTRFGREVKKRITVMSERSSTTGGIRRTFLQGVRATTESDNSSFPQNSKNSSTVAPLTCDDTVDTVESEPGQSVGNFSPNQLSLFGDTELDSTVLLYQPDVFAGQTRNSSEATVGDIDHETVAEDGYPWVMWCDQDPATRPALVTDSYDDLGDSVLDRAGFLTEYDAK
jgi:putative DNA primase/helicase